MKSLESKGGSSSAVSRLCLLNATACVSPCCSPIQTSSLRAHSSAVWMRLLSQGGSRSRRKPLPGAVSWRQLHRSLWGCGMVPQMQLEKCLHYIGALNFLLLGFPFSSFYFFLIFRDHFSFTVFNETFSSSAISNSSIFSLQEHCCFYWSSIPFIIYKAIHRHSYICVYTADSFPFVCLFVLCCV